MPPTTKKIDPKLSEEEKAVVAKAPPVNLDPTYVFNLEEEQRALEAASLSSQEEEEEVEKPLTPEEKMSLLASELAANSPNAPSEQQLKNWKQLHKSLFYLKIDNDFSFVFRYLKRQEYIQMLATYKDAKLTDEQENELIFNACVLWPRFTEFEKAALPANTITLLTEEVRIQSLFLDAGAVASQVLKI